MSEPTPDVATMSETEGQPRQTWQAQASAEYRKLEASLAVLRSQLVAMGVTVDADAPPGGQNTTLSQDLYPSPTQPQPPAHHTRASPAHPTEQEADVRVYMLGPFHMEAQGHSLKPSMPGQVKTVLEYLIAHGRRPTPKDALIDLLWPDTDPSVACGRLRVVMHSLRRLIPGPSGGLSELVLTTGNNFMLNPNMKIWVDVEEFERRWQQGWRLARAGRKQEALREYERAEELYIGDFLEDQPYADWTLLRRETLRDAYASILTMLANISLESHDYTGTIIWAQKLLAQDNCREDAYRLLMVSYQRLGQLSRAVYWYNLCMRTMQRELGMEPSPETQAVYRAIYGDKP